MFALVISVVSHVDTQPLNLLERHLAWLVVSVVNSDYTHIATATVYFQSPVPFLWAHHTK